MYKKIALVFLALVIFLFPISQILQQNQAYAIATKVATKVATQAVKEVIKDAAKEKAFAMALDEVGKIYDPDNKYTFKEGYEGYCVEVKKPDGSCDKPVQIKKEITDADTKKLDDSVGKKLDAKIGGDLYSTKWGKYLDYVVPIYAISAAGVAVDYAVNGEDSIAGLMNEVAMEALEDAGIIQTAELTDPLIVDDTGAVMQSEEMVSYHADPKTEYPYSQNTEMIFTHQEHYAAPYYSLEQWVRIDLPDTIRDFVVVVDRAEINDPTPEVSPETIGNVTMKWLSYRTMMWSMKEDGVLELGEESGENVLYKNGEEISRWHQGGTSINPKILLSSEFEASPMKKIITSFEDNKPTRESNEYFRTKLITLENGDKYEHTIKQGGTATKDTWSAVQLYEQVEPGEQVAYRVQVFDGGSFEYTPYYPNWIDIVENMEEKPLDMTIFEKDQDTVSMPPIASMNYTGLDGQPLTIVKDPATGETGFTDASGSPVNEDSISVNPGTGYTKTPEGITYNPTNPIPDNPDGQTEIFNPPATDTPTDPGDGDGTTPPPGTDEPPLEPFPDGEKCEEGLKFPIFSPLKETFSTSFPFSIPWDIERAINAAFSGIGTEKPSFSLDLEFLGSTETIKITTPALFDDWKPFTDTLLVLIFDVMIMFGVYRFVKGAGS